MQGGEIGPQGETVILSLRPALLFLLSLAMLALGCGAVRAQGIATDKELVVATKESPPFAMKQPDGSWGGISIELWRRIADRAHLKFRLVETESVQDLLDGVAKGAFDAGVAAVARDRRACAQRRFHSTFLQHRAQDCGADQ